MRAILFDGKAEFAARALTRDMASEEAQLLAMTGSEVVAGDVNDEASLRRGFAEAYGAFCLVGSKEPGSPQEKIARAVTMARAARGAGLHHVVWATLETAPPASTLEGHAILPVAATPASPANPERRSAETEHSRLTTEKAFADFGVPVTFLRASWSTPTATGPVAEEIGKCAFRILRSHELIGKTLSISEELMALEAARPESDGGGLAVAGASKPVERKVPWMWMLVLIGVMAGAGIGVRFYRKWTSPSAPVIAGDGVREGASAAAPPSPAPAGFVAAGTAGVLNGPGSVPVVPLTAPRPSAIEPVSTGRGLASGGAQANRATATGLRARQKRRLRGGGAPRQSRGRGHSPSISADDDGTAPGLDPAQPRSPVASSGAGGTGTGTGLASTTRAGAAAAASSTEAAASATPARGPGEGAPPSLTPGFVDPRAVTATVRAHAAEVRACFDRALMERADLHGRLTVKAMLDGSGSVLTASSARAMEGGGRLEACVVSAFQGWRFPPPAGGVAGPITYSFSFE